jgi:polysaccharide pyruvyl transferase WcaK-like protein
LSQLAWYVVVKSLAPVVQRLLFWKIYDLWSNLDSVTYRKRKSTKLVHSAKRGLAIRLQFPAEA